MHRYRLTCGAIFKNESRNLAEWITFHELLGVEHFFLYNNESDDRPEAVLEPFIASGLVTLIDFPGRAVQAAMLNDCVQRAKGVSYWLTLIDIDEFLFPTAGGSLPAALDAYEHAPAVAVNWVLFGSSGHAEPPDDLVINAYQQRGALDHRIPHADLILDPTRDPFAPSNYRPINTHVKTIVQPDRVVRFLNPHFAEYEDGVPAVDEQGDPVTAPWTDRVSVETLRINHYWSKSRAEMVRKHRRGCASDGFTLPWNEFEMRDAASNHEHDDLITRYVPDVRDRLGS